MVENGISSQEVICLEVIYRCLLHEFKQDVYSRIVINQIGDDLEEFVLKKGKGIHCNIWFPSRSSFPEWNDFEKNIELLDKIHCGLLAIAKYDNKLDENALNAIRKKIIDNKFSFEFVYKTFVKSKKSSLSVKLAVRPLINNFIYYCIIEEDNIVKSKIQIYNGLPCVYFGEFLFYYGKWQARNELVLTGIIKEVEIHVNVDDCQVEIINRTPYSNPPFFTAMRFDISEEEREKAGIDVEHLYSLSR